MTIKCSWHSKLHSNLKQDDMEAIEMAQQRGSESTSGEATANNFSTLASSNAHFHFFAGLPTYYLLFRRIVTVVFCAVYKYSYLLTYLLTYLATSQHVRYFDTGVHI